MVSEAVILGAGEGTRLSKVAKTRPKPLLRVGGVPILERVSRSLRELGVTKVHMVIGYEGRKIVEKFGKDYDGLTINYVENPEWEKGNLYSLLAAKKHQKGEFLLLMADHLFDPRIVKHLMKRELGDDALILAVDRENPAPEDTKVLENDGRIINTGKKIREFNCLDTGIFLCSPRIFHYAEEAARSGCGELANCVKHAAEDGVARTFDIGEISSYVPKMRKKVEPYWVDVDTPQDLERAKDTIIQSSAKEASDFLAHYVHRPVENSIVRHLSETKITPNQMTILVNIVAYTATALFLLGNLLAASILTFIVGIMDGLDGKLARVRGESSKLGTMEHPFDLLFEFSWLAALGIYLSYSMESLLPLIFSMLAIIFIAFYRQVYDRFGRTMGRSLDDYGGFERKFRRMAGRRNLYNIHILIWVLIGLPFYCLVTILGHAVLTAGVYGTRVCTHMHAADKNKLGVSEKVSE